MNSWRDAVLDDFIPGVSKLTLVSDPDNLLTEEKLALELKQRGFDLIEFNDPIEFRYVYESKYRSIWDRGEKTDLVVILRLQGAELESLPYDLLQAGRRLSFNLGDLFPKLSYPVIEKLDRSLLDLVFDAQCKSQLDRMGDNATKDFILLHVFGVVGELVTNEVEILRFLLRSHYGKLDIPQMLLDRLLHVFKSSGVFETWPLDEIISDDEAFYAFLQERWPVFLAGEASQYGLRYPGPEHLPFEHQDIRVYIDNLFLEGKLTPVETLVIDEDRASWIRSGIKIVGEDREELRISRLFDLVKKELPSETARYSDWITFALKWAELSSLTYCSNTAKYIARLKEVGESINDHFAGWLVNHYAGLINLPPTNPAMLHHVSRRLARGMEESSNSGVALVVVDGLALDQWVTLRQLLQKQNDNLVMRESATFAWIPTLTSVSRQSIFSGKPPLYFPASINSTNSEEKLWKQFWEGHGLSKLDVLYQRSLADGDASSLLDALVNSGKTKVLGLVVDKVDKIMHGMQLGAVGMHNQIKQWGQSGFLGELLACLLDYGYEVWLTSDHGNIECEGKGRPSEGVIAETRGERVRVYPTSGLRSRAAQSFVFAREWLPVGLPENYFPLIAGNRDAFVNPGDTLVGHGGAALEEVIVPLIKFERKLH